MEIFICRKDLSNINDSMELESGQEIARLIKDGYAVTIEVRGEVRVVYDGDTYRDVSQFPDELVKMFHDGSAYDSDDVYIDMNNWFEAFFLEVKGGSMEWTGYSDTVDCETLSKDEIKAFITDCLEMFLDELNS